MKKHSVSLHGHATSFSLEDAFFDELKAIAHSEGKSLANIIQEIDDNRTENLSCALRLYVLRKVKEQQNAS